MISRVLSGILFPFLFLSATSFAEPQVLLAEDFGSYASESELSAAWPKVGNATTHLATDPVDSDNTVLFSKGDLRTRTFAAVTPTNDRPLRVSVDYYDDYQQDAPGREYIEENIPGREYIGLWAGPFNSTALIEVGLHNHLGSNDSGCYTARVSEGELDWVDLETERKAGWRKIQLWVFANTVEIYIDGEFDTVVDWAGGLLSAVRLGFGSGSGDSASRTGVYYDNLRIEQVEAPGDDGMLLELSQRRERILRPLGERAVTTALR